MRAGRLVLLAALLLLLATAGAAGAQRTQRVDLSYEVGGLDPANGTTDVDLIIENDDDTIDSMIFHTATHRFEVTNVSASGGTLEEKPAGVKLTFEPGPTILHFTVAVEAETFKGSDGFNAYLSEEWGVLKAEALGLGFSTRHDGRFDLVWDTTLRFRLPDGWDVAGPWNHTGPTSFELPPGDALPRGFYAVGEDLDVSRREGPWKSYRYVQIGQDLSYESDLFPYLEDATPYYASVYGNHTGANLLAVSAPDPMHQGGLGGWNSLYVHEDTDLKTLAHEYAHVWQRYRPVTTVDAPEERKPALEGGSSLWIVEGDADYRGPLSLVATEFWSPSEADSHFETVEDRASREDRLTVPLDQATYGNTHERVAYQKGALVMHALQRGLTAATDGQADSATLVRRLNEEHSPVAPGYTEERSPDEEKVNNSEIRALVADLASPANESERASLLDDLDGFVHDRKAPTFHSIERSGHLTFDELTIAPPTALEGDPSNLTVRVTNTGPTREDRTVRLWVDGGVVDDRDVSLAAGGSEVIQMKLPDLAPGSYDVRVAYLEASYRVLEPAEMVLSGVELVPAGVVQGEDVTILADVGNRGGAGGEALVEVRLDGEEAGSGSRFVEGGINATLSVTVRPEEPGQREVAVGLVHDGSTVDSVTRMLNVAADRDGDGVPDGKDAYPENPNLAHGTALNDVRNVVPGSPAAALLAASLAALLARRRA